MARHTLQYPVATTGLAIGRAHRVVRDLPQLPQYWCTTREIETEIARLQQAAELAHQQLSRIRDQFCRYDNPEQRNILEAHILLTQDAMLIEKTTTLIRERAINTEWALHRTVAELTQILGEVADPYLQERRHDVEQVSRRIMRNLLGAPEPSYQRAPYAHTILISGDLSPAEVAALPRRVKGFLTARGGPTSHTAIIARSLEIPAILGAKTALPHIQEGDTLIIDAEGGTLLIAPDAKETKAYQKKHAGHLAIQRAYHKEGALPAITRDGATITLGANIELLHEVPIALDHGAAQVGMFRTEYLYMNRPQIPSEEEQYADYRRILEQMAPRPVTIRTLDVGGDKVAEFAEYTADQNPAMGLRAIRFCLRERAIFTTQLRALYRAGVHGKLRILFPMISGMEELRQIQALIAEVQGQLRREKQRFATKVPLGVMIEIPAAVMIADQLAQVADFFSIGTNDLTQYTLAVDRSNEHVAYLFHSLHPAVLRMIQHTVTVAQRAKIPVTLCGEMAGDPLALLPLLGMGLTLLSMNSVSIPRVKHVIRETTLRQAKALAKRALQAATPAEVEALVKAVLPPITPRG